MCKFSNILQELEQASQKLSYSSELHTVDESGNELSSSSATFSIISAYVTPARRDSFESVTLFDASDAEIDNIIEDEGVYSSYCVSSSNGSPVNFLVPMMMSKINDQRKCAQREASVHNLRIYTQNMVPSNVLTSPKAPSTAPPRLQTFKNIFASPEPQEESKMSFLQESTPLADAFTSNKNKLGSKVAYWCDETRSWVPRPVGPSSFLFAGM